MLYPPAEDVAFPDLRIQISIDAYLAPSHALCESAGDVPLHYDRSARHPGAKALAHVSAHPKRAFSHGVSGPVPEIAFDRHVLPVPIAKAGYGEYRMYREIFRFAAIDERGTQNSGFL